MDAEMNRKLSAVSPEEVETDTVKQEYGERMKKEIGFVFFFVFVFLFLFFCVFYQRIAQTFPY